MTIAETPRRIVGVDWCRSMYRRLVETMWRGAQREIRLSTLPVVEHPDNVACVISEGVEFRVQYLSAAELTEAAALEPLNAEDFPGLPDIPQGYTPRPIHAYPVHEHEIVATLEGEARWREKQLQQIGYDEALRDHYLHGGNHPDDQRIPLNKWDETP